MSHTRSPYRTDKQIQALIDAAENGESYTSIHAYDSAHAGYATGVVDALAWIFGETSGHVFRGFSATHATREEHLGWIGRAMTNAAMTEEK